MEGVIDQAAIKPEAAENECLVRDDCLFKQSIFYPPAGAWISPRMLTVFRWTFLMVCIVFFVSFATYAFFLFSPIQTVDFCGPVQILNPGRKVPVGGVVHMRVKYTKFTNSPGLVIRTLVKKVGEDYIPIVSNTTVSYRKKGSGVTDSLLPVFDSQLAVGTECYVVFSIYHHIYGRTILKTFSTEPFEIVTKGDAPCPGSKP